MLQSTVNFLFVPESSLSIVFLGIFVLIFIYGFWHLRSCRKGVRNFYQNAADRFALEHGRITAASFIARFDESQKIREIRIESLPNIFVTVGILGTFLGLGVAIHGASELLSSEKIDLVQLNAVLSVIAFKFQTSIWGTLFSLLFLKCFNEPYYAYRQKAVCDVLDQIAGDEASAESILASQLEALKGIRSGQEKFVTVGESIGKAVQETGIEQMAAGLKRTEAMQESLEAMRSELSSEIGAVHEQVSQDIDSVHKRVAHDINSVQEKLSKDIHSVNEQVSQDINSVQEQLSQDINSVNERVSQDINSVQEQLSKDINTVNEQLSQDIGTMQSQLTGDIGSVETHLTDEIQNQQAVLGDMFDEQNRLNESFFGSVQNDFNSQNKSFAEQITEELASQREKTSELIEQNKSMGKLLDQQAKLNQSILGEAEESYAQNAKSFVAQVVDALGEQKESISELLAQQNALTETFFGSAKEGIAKEAKHFASGLAAELTKQREETAALIAGQEAMATMLKEQNQRAKELLGDAGKAYAQGAKSFTERIDEALETQHVRIESLIEQQNELHKSLAALLGDTATDMEKSSQSFLSSITMELAAQRGFMQELLQKQNDITAELNKAQKEFWGETKDAYTSESKSFVDTMTEQMKLQKAFLQKVIDQQTELAKHINEEQAEYMRELIASQDGLIERFNDQCDALLGKQREENAKHDRDFLTGLDEKLATQKEDMAALVAEHARLSKVLLGDLEKSNAENLAATNEGFVKHMEDYKAFAEKIAREQQRVQDVLAAKLDSYTKDMEAVTKEHRSSIAEIGKVLAVLHAALENNSKILNDIIENFYATQDNLDAVRRKEIQGLADAFTSMLKHESTSPAAWRKSEKTVKEAVRETRLTPAKGEAKGK